MRGLLLTRYEKGGESYNRLIGEDGTIEANGANKPPLRTWGKGQSQWEPVETNQEEAVKLGILDLVDALKTGREPELSSRKALRTTGLIFATYASSLRRGRINLPLELDDLKVEDAVEK